MITDRLRSPHDFQSTQRDLPSPKQDQPRVLATASWIQLFGACLAFVLISFYAATQSELANYISPGESPFFQWVRIHISALLWCGLGYLLLASTVQAVRIRSIPRSSRRGMTALVGIELIAIGMLAYTLLSGSNALLASGHALLQASVLFQVYMNLWGSTISAQHKSLHLLDFPDDNDGVFLLSLFFFAAIPAALDPSWHRMQEYVHLDSTFEILWSYLLPALLSGITVLWLGIGTLVILGALRALWTRLDSHSRLRERLVFAPFLFNASFYAMISLASLAYGIEWELTSLRLRSALIPLFIFLAGGGGALSYVAFRRLAPYARRMGAQSLIGMMALSMGAVLVFPITWMLTRRESGPRPWRYLLTCSLFGSLFLLYTVLYGNLFNPWFTVFSYLKGSILKITAVIAAGILVLVFEELRSGETRTAPRTWKRWIAIACIVPLGLLPFASLERYRETKAAVLQFNESSMVDATYARVLSDLMGLEGWVRLGQGPESRHHAEPWPLPWMLARTGPSRLPKDFNLVVVVVDALRGDAFHSAGYHRNLTPFLDRWAGEEGVSFRRAYSQGGGTFAAFPFLVAGRSRFSSYDPQLHHENLYFKLAQAEGIHNVMVVKPFGPRAIFPPDYPVIELGGSDAYDDRHSVPADAVFGWAQEAIAKLAKRERFLAFLHLMDVHNDLWKKADGLDFGDSPRDLYDNNVSYIDRAFRRFVGWLKNHGVYHRTVIMVTSDHGEQFWEHGASLHGHTVYEEEIRIPVILVAHGIRGRVEDVPVVAADMAPTIAELAGYSVHPPYDDPRMGISLVPLLLENERDQYLKRDILGRASFKQRFFLYRNWEWKLVYSADFDLLQLFNTRRDAVERKNLLQEEPEIAAELERELLGYLERVAGQSYRPLLEHVSW